MLAESLYQLYSKTLAKPGKKKNGDYVKVLDTPSYVLALVADGITSIPCDWKASQTVCENMAAHVGQHINNSDDLTELLSNGLHNVNKDLLYEVGECDGLGTTICGLLWVKQTNDVHYFWLGDSRVYFYQASQLQQISIDDSEEYVSSKDILPGANVYSRSLITNSLGRSDFRVHIKKHRFEAGSAFFIATDGFVESTASFNESIINCLNSGDFEKPLNNLFTQNRIDQRDDATAVMLRRAYTKITNSEILKLINGQSPAPDRFYELQVVYEALVLAVETHQDKLCEQALVYIQKRNLKFGKKLLLDLLSLIIERDYKAGGLYNAVVLLIGKSE